MSLDALPRLLPADAIPGADDAERFEWASDAAPGFIDYSQIFITDDLTQLLLVTSNLEQFASTPESSRSYVEVAPWDTAFFSLSGPGYANLTLVDPGGLVMLNGRNMSEDEVLAAASSMGRRPVGEPGWEIPALVGNMTLFHEGWASGVASRGVRWLAGGNLVAELDIASGAPSLLDPQLDLDTAIITEIAGARAIVAERPGFNGPPTTLIMWSPQPEVAVYFGMQAPLDEALSVARSLREVDLATWEAAAHPPVDPSDGCNSFRC